MPIKSKRKTTPKQDAETQKAAEELASGETEGLSPEALVLYATLETGFLAACADGELDQEEYDTLGASFNTWTGADLDAEALQKLFEAFIAMLEEDGLDGCIARAASHLDEEQRRAAFDFAAAITIVSGDTSEDEIAGLQFIAQAFEIADEEARDRWIAVGEALAELAMPALVITRPDGTSRAISGYVYEEPAADAQEYVPGDDVTPRPKVDLRPLLTEVENQGQTNSCAANAVAGAYEYLVQRHLPEDETYDVSRMFIYYAGREEGGGPIEDEGSVLRHLISSLKTKGAPSEETWPFDLAKVNERPSDEAYTEASEFVVEDALHIATDLHTWKCALTEGHPIIFGMKLFDSFDAHRKPGLVPAPTAAETGRASHGGHAMLAVGYSDKDKVFIVRNSWGPTWGDGGYCYIPYDYLVNPKYNFGDSWIIKQVASLDAEEGWAEDDDDESLLPTLENELANMSEEDYGALLEAMGDTPLETRIAHILLAVAGADGDVADAELESLSAHLATVMEQLGSQLDPAKVLRFAKKHDEDQELFDESVELLGQHLSAGLLAAIIQMAREVADADETSEDEEDLLAHLVESWQIEE